MQEAHPLTPSRLGSSGLQEHPLPREKAPLEPEGLAERSAHDPATTTPEATASLVLLKHLRPFLDLDVVGAFSMQGLDPAGFVRTHQVAIWRYLRVLGCPLDEAEDLTQETFLTVLRTPFRELGARTSAAYLRRVARNLFLKSKRRTSRQLDEVALEEVELTWQLLWEEDGGDGYLDALRSCLARLQGKARAAVELVYQEGQSHRAAAVALQMSRVGITTLLRRVRGGLRRCIEREIKR